MEPSPNNSVPTLETDYGYDVMGNLWNVVQLGDGTSHARNRSFTYDSLSRLICASNPENSQNSCPTSATSAMPSGVLSYGYDPNSNLFTKTDARGVTTNYAYDTLNRLLSKTYTNDPSKTLSSCYQYDQSTIPDARGNLIGRPTNSWTQSGACSGSPQANGYTTHRSILGYDAMGRVLKEQQCHRDNCSTRAPYSTEASYDLAGQQNSYANAVQPIDLTNYYDSAGRLQHLDSDWTDSLHPATLFSVGAYTPADAIQNMTLGTGINVTKTYDNRLRVTSETATHP
jgi:YD repeat-containing protein